MARKKTTIIAVITTLVMLTITLLAVKYTEQNIPEPPVDETQTDTPETTAAETTGNIVESTSAQTEEHTTAESTTEPQTTETTPVTTAPQTTPPPVQTPPQNDVQPTYINGILVVNKTYALPQSYAPGWDTEASSQLWKMFAAAKTDGISLWVKSGYRSYIDQKIIYNGYVANDGQENADRYSARPGHSEHQTGLAFDLNSLSQDFGTTPEGIWLAQNCYKYGFIIRYPKEKENITGYMYEPWHVRYLGIEKATAVFESGLCLEEYLGITSEYAE